MICVGCVGPRIELCCDNRLAEVQIPVVTLLSTRDIDHAKYFLPNGLRFETRQCKLQEPDIMWTRFYVCNETQLKAAP
jgi:hypothetical protein